LEGLICQGDKTLYPNWSWRLLKLSKKNESFTEIVRGELLFPMSSGPQNQASKKQNSNHQQGIGDSSAREKILPVHLSTPSNLLLSDNHSVMSNPTIPKGKLSINNFLYSLREETPKKPGTTNNNPNHPEVKLTNKEANTSSVVLADTNFIERK
jgi:hypothetical protein